MHAYDDKDSVCALRPTVDFVSTHVITIVDHQRNQVNNYCIISRLTNKFTARVTQLSTADTFATATQKLAMHKSLQGDSEIRIGS